MPFENVHFDYLFQVSEVPIVYLTGRVHGAIDHGVRQLVGYEPVLEAKEYSPAPWKQFARITLRPSDPRNACAVEASFSVDRGLIRCLQAGDLFHVRGVHPGSFAIAILRDGALIAAAGDLCDMPLGEHAHVRTVAVCEQGLRHEITPGRDGYCAAPVEVHAEGASTVLYGGRPTLGPYDVFVRSASSGPWPCVSIERTGVCPETSAHTSAQLFDQEGLHVRPREA